MQEFDFSILYALQNLHMPVLNEFMIVFTFLGNAGLIWLFFALAALISKKHRKLGIRMLVSLLFTVVISCLIVKNLVQRDRPCWIDPSVAMLIKVPEDFSFPSGHTTSSFACAIVLFRYKKLWGIPALLVASIIAFSRMYLFVHFPTDVAVGLLIGVTGSLIADYLMVKALRALSLKFPKLLGEETTQELPAREPSVPSSAAPASNPKAPQNN